MKLSDFNFELPEDRLAEFQGLAQKYNGSELYNFENIMVLSGGTRDPDADDVSGIHKGQQGSAILGKAQNCDDTSLTEGVYEQVVVSHVHEESTY